MVGEQTLQDAHRIAALEPWRLRTNPLRSRLADRRDNPVGDAFFNAALRRANNLKDAFLMARSLILRRDKRRSFQMRLRRSLLMTWPCVVVVRAARLVS